MTLRNGIRGARGAPACARPLLALVALVLVTGSVLSPALAAVEGAPHHGGGEANLRLPDLSQVSFMGGIDGHTLLMWGLVCAWGFCSGW